MVSAPRQVTRWAHEVAACHRQCRAVRNRLADALESHGWAEDQAFRVLVCAGEALANAVTHGSGRDDAVRVRFAVSATHATMIVTDGGEPVAALPRVVPDETSEHGRGLVLMRALADSLHIRQRPTGTLVALAFRAG